MDPNETWKLMVKAFSIGNWQDAQVHAEDLLGWLSKNGFPPRLCVTDPDGLFKIDLEEDSLNRIVAESVANKIIRVCQ